MTLCPSCAAPLSGPEPVHFTCGAYYGPDWHLSNRIWGDYFHRGIEIARVDDFKDEPVPELAFD